MAYTSIYIFLKLLAYQLRIKERQNYDLMYPFACPRKQFRLLFFQQTMENQHLFSMTRETKRCQYTVPWDPHDNLGIPHVDSYNNKTDRL